MKKTVSVILAILASVALFFTVFLTCINSVAFDESRYAAYQQKYGIANDMGVSQADLTKITHDLLLYCKGQRSTLDMQYPVDGQMREIFDEREKEHMVDVQALFVKEIHARNGLAGAFVVCVLLLILTARKKAPRELARGWIVSIIVLGALLVAMGVYFATDFDRAWTQFHHVFFTNDLWLLYDNEALIQMLIPSIAGVTPIFDIIIQQVVILSAAVLAALTALAIATRRLTKPGKPQDDANAG